MLRKWKFWDKTSSEDLADGALEESSKKKAFLHLPTEVEDAPVKNFLILLLLIPAAPFILIYSIVTGRLQNPFIVGACLTMILGGGIYYMFADNSAPKPSKSEILNSMIEELSEAEKAELRAETSTLRTSIGVEKIPSTLAPMLDIPQDMVTINYYNYLIQSGNMGKNAEGSVHILQNALFSENPPLKEAAWKSLYAINTAESKSIMNLYTKQVEEEKRKLAAAKAKPIHKSLPKSFFGDSWRALKNMF